jgi:hypothetical protein
MNFLIQIADEAKTSPELLHEAPPITRSQIARLLEEKKAQFAAVGII